MKQTSRQSDLEKIYEGWSVTVCGYKSTLFRLFVYTNHTVYYHALNRDVNQVLHYSQIYIYLGEGRWRERVKSLCFDCSALKCVMFINFVF